MTDVHFCLELINLVVLSQCNVVVLQVCKVPVWHLLWIKNYGVFIARVSGAFWAFMDVLVCRDLFFLHKIPMYLGDCQGSSQNIVLGIRVGLFI